MFMAVFWGFPEHAMVSHPEHGAEPQQQAAPTLGAEVIISLSLPSSPSRSLFFSLSLSLALPLSLLLFLSLGQPPETRRRAAKRGAASSWERGQGRCN